MLVSPNETKYNEGRSMSEPTLFVIGAGGPGTGKGTQLKNLADPGKGIFHISTGDLFRALDATKEPGTSIAATLASGALVSDEQTLALLKANIPANARVILLDGYPRTPQQAQDLADYIAESGGKLAKVLWFVTPLERLFYRLTGRVTCSGDDGCGEIFNIHTNPPEEDGKCDLCGGELVERDDQKVVANRIAVFVEQTLPMHAFYKDLDVFAEVDADRPIEEIAAEVEFHHLTGII